MVLLVIYCCITNYPKTLRVKIITFILITLCVDQELENRLDRWLWLRVSHEIIVQMLSGYAVI